MYNDTLFVSGPPKYWNGRWHQLFIWSLKKAILLQHIETAREDGSSKPMRIFSPFKEYCCCSMPRSCLTLCNRMDCSLPGTSVHGISQASILEWVAISSSRASSWPRDWNWVSCIGRWILYHWIVKIKSISFVKNSICQCLECVLFLYSIDIEKNNTLR